MAESNVEIYKRLIEAFNERGIDGALAYYSDDAEVYDPDLPEGGTYRGREGVRHVLSQLVDGDDVEIRAAELHPVGDRIIALIHHHRRSQSNGAEAEIVDAHTLTFRDGKVVYWRLYLDPVEAFADAGLEPPGKSAG